MIEKEKRQQTRNIIETYIILIGFSLLFSHFGKQEEKEIAAAESKKRRRTASTNGVRREKYISK
jgi:hypothetical protein